jgi:hypothetical protein
VPDRLGVAEAEAVPQGLALVVGEGEELLERQRLHVGGAQVPPDVELEAREPALEGEVREVHGGRCG